MTSYPVGPHAQASSAQRRDISKNSSLHALIAMENNNYGEESSLKNYLHLFQGKNLITLGSKLYLVGNQNDQMILQNSSNTPV